MRKMMFRNEDVHRVLMGVPQEHRHIRTVLDARDDVVILQEVTIASIVRAFITLKTHPTLCGIELVQRSYDERKEGYAKHQLVESEKGSEDVVSELSQIVKEQ